MISASDRYSYINLNNKVYRVNINNGDKVKESDHLQTYLFINLRWKSDRT